MIAILWSTLVLLTARRRRDRACVWLAIHRIHLRPFEIAGRHDAMREAMATHIFSAGSIPHTP